MRRACWWLIGLALIVSGCERAPIGDSGEQASIGDHGLEIPKVYAEQIRRKYPAAEIQFYYERRKTDANSAYCTLYRDGGSQDDPKKSYGVIYFDPKTRRLAAEMWRVLVREANDKVVDKFREDFPDFRIWQMYRIKYSADHPDKPGVTEYQFWALDDKTMMIVSYGMNRRQTAAPYLFDGAEFNFIPPTSIPAEVSNGLYRSLGYTTRYGASHLELYGDKVYKIYTNVPEDMSRLRDLPGSFRRRELWPRLPLIVLIDSKGNVIDTYFGYNEN